MSEFEPTPELSLEHPEVQIALVHFTQQVIESGLANRYNEAKVLSARRFRKFQDLLGVNFIDPIKITYIGLYAEAPYAVRKEMQIFEGKKEDRLFLAKVNRQGIVISGSSMQVGIVDHATQEVRDIEESFNWNDLETVLNMSKLQDRLPWHPIYDKYTSGLLSKPPS